MSRIKIIVEKNIPIDDCIEYTQQRYPWKSMDIGDSFRVPKRLRQSVEAAAAYQKRQHGTAYTVRERGNYVRIWRIE